MTAGKSELIESFDPNGPGIPGNLFGLPFTPETAELIIIPVPWEVTVSYHTGTAQGPMAILNASTQVDLFQLDVPDAWKLGIAMLPIPQEIFMENEKLRELSGPYIRSLEKNSSPDPSNPVLKK